MNSLMRMLSPVVCVLAMMLFAPACSEKEGGASGLFSSCSGGGCDNEQECSGEVGVCWESCGCTAEEIKARKACTSNKCASTGTTMCAPRKCGTRQTYFCSQVCDPTKNGTDCPGHDRGVYCKPVPFSAGSGVVRYVCMPLCEGEKPPDIGVDSGTVDSGTMDSSSTVDSGGSSTPDMSSNPG